MKIYHPKTIKKAIDELQTFLECDLYTKFRPDALAIIKWKGKIWRREDSFRNEKQFIEYLQCHFNVLRKDIKKCLKSPSPKEKCK